jgi:hypothetical protein
VAAQPLHVLAVEVQHAAQILERREPLDLLAERRCNTVSMSLFRRGSVRCAKASRRGRSVSIRVLTLAALSPIWVGCLTQAHAALQAPGLFAGPQVVRGGLIWAGSLPGQENVFLSTVSSTRLLVRDAELSEVRVDDGWVVVANPSGVRAARIGRPLRAVQALRRCPSSLSEREGDQDEAVANGNLYAVVRASCLGLRPGGAQLLVGVRLGTGKLRVIGMVSGGANSLAAAGSRLALTYEAGARPADEALAPRRVRVEVVDARTARLLYRLSPPPGQSGRYRETQLDTKGDVLVTSVGHLPDGHASGWWGNPRTRVGRPLESENTGPAASLSEGRIAYASSREGETSIDVLDLASGRTRTTVTFSGSARLQGFGLGRTVLAWAQQSYAYKLYTERHEQGRPSCVGEAPVGSTELIETPLSAVGLPIVVTASPGPRPAGRRCPVPPLSRPTTPAQ